MRGINETDVKIIIGIVPMTGKNLKL